MKKKRCEELLLLVLVGLCFALISPGATAQGRDSKEAVGVNDTFDKGSLKLSLCVPKTNYAVGEPIAFEVFLVNKGTGPLYVHSELNWGYSASLTLLVFDSNGRIVSRDFMDDSIPRPTSKKNRPPSIMLNPNHLFGTLATRTPPELGLSKGTSYTLQVEYLSPVASTAFTESPFWGKEKGAIRSNPVKVAILP